MRKHPLVIASVMIGLAVFAARAQPEAPSKPIFDGALAKLFGNNTRFSASIDFHVTRFSGGELSMEGKIAVLDGKSRVDMDLSNVRGASVSPEAAAQMKEMGMSKMTAITLRDKKLSYIVYPDMKAYLESAGRETGTAPAEYKTKVTKLGEETVDGRNCVKDKVSVTGPDGFTHESTVWYAPDLNQFPVEIQTTSEKGVSTVMIFKDVKLGKPDAAQFDIPADFTKYDNMLNLMMSRARKAPQ